jgi:signal-transduction protein with cAMP-binding, CBS, and nucleotidyltransferase domain
MLEITSLSKSYKPDRPPMRIRKRSGIHLESTNAEQLGILPHECILVKNAMSRSMSVVTPLTEIREAVRLMKSLDVGALVVCNGSALVGILFDRDIALANTGPLKPIHKVMTVNPSFCFENDLLVDVHAMMHARGLTALPVRDFSGRFSGIVRRPLGEL